MTRGKFRGTDAGRSRKARRPRLPARASESAPEPQNRAGGTLRRSTPDADETIHGRFAETRGARKEGGQVVVYGLHAVREALRSGRRAIVRVFATAEVAGRLATDLAAAGRVAEIVEAKDIAHRLGSGAVHQGIMIEAGPLPEVDLDEIVSQSGIVLMLDQITDPHNVGAIFRTAAAFGVDALVMTERHSPELSGLVAKAASGGLEHVPVVTVVNLARALEHLADLGYRRIGLDSEAPASLAELDLARPLALVLGGEGKGLRRLTREKCDDLARLHLPGAIKSLNVSNACAVALTLVHSRLPPAK